MSVFIIGNIVVENPANLSAYKEAAAASMKEFGIGMLGQVAPQSMLEGEFVGAMVVLEAESEATARAWYASDSYAKAIAARSPDAKFTIAIVPAAGS